jgi:hypothetical protein
MSVTCVGALHRWHHIAEIVAEIGVTEQLRRRQRKVA